MKPRITTRCRINSKEYTVVQKSSFLEWVIYSNNMWYILSILGLITQGSARDFDNPTCFPSRVSLGHIL